MKKKFSLIAIISLICISALGCGKKEPEIVGKWMLEDANIPVSLELYNDGTGILCNYEDDSITNSYECSWVINDECIKLSVNLGVITETTAFDYLLTEDTLTLNTEDSSVTYIREK